MTDAKCGWRRNCQGATQPGGLLARETFDFINVVENFLAALEIYTSDFGQADTPRGAVKQACAEVGFQSCITDLLTCARDSPRRSAAAVKPSPFATSTNVFMQLSLSIIVHLYETIS